MSRRIYLGLDIGGTNLVAGAVQRAEDGALAPATALLSLEKAPTLAAEGPDAVIARSAALLRQALAKTGCRPEELVAVGVGMPGPLDVGRGVVVYAPNFPGWQNVPLVARLRAAMGVPVHMENDARMVTYGEFRFGAGRGFQNLIGITLGTGIGSGLIIGGELYVGALSGTAGEIGHMTIEPDGLRCGCGNQGCLETLAAAPAIVAATHRLLLSGRPSALAERDLGTLTAGDVAAAAAAGDEAAREVFARAGYYLGIAAANLINALNPEAIIFGGGVAQAGELLFEPIRRTVRLRALRGIGDRTAILAAELGDPGGVLGAAAWAMRCADSAPAPRAEGE
ncbi:MAG: ROK family protein [Chloroflexota bacterium]